ncbi:MAG TPA: PilZ domain-containing protein [Polyangia bacterium]|jgi:PilZ domain.|nr:PilZ domain-containing protein [Polyangia bacterium]
MQFERRRAERDRRHDGRVPAVFAVRNLIGSRLQLGQAEDIAPTGITLRRPRDVPVLPQTPLTLHFDLPGAGACISVAGRVVTDRRSGPFRRTGVQFTEISSESAALLAEFCARRVLGPRGMAMNPR